MSLDLAAVDACTDCGAPVRHFANIPAAMKEAGTELPNTIWCRACLQAKCVAAADEVRARRDAEVAMSSPRSTRMAAGDTGGDIGTAASQMEGPYSARFPSSSVGEKSRRAPAVAAVPITSP